MIAALRADLLPALLIGAAFVALFVAAEAWRHWGRPPVEFTRKLVHLGGGLIAAFFPWLLGSGWTVLVLALAFLGILWGTKRLGLLQSVHGVERRSDGGVLFPIAIGLVYLIGADRRVFYLIAVLVLVVADAAAAVFGSLYGRLRYDVERDRRSVEGSTVFFLVTFLIVHLPLLLLTDIPRGTSVLVAAQLALLVTLLEAISLEGNDNLIVPLATFFLLHKLTRQTADALVGQLAAQGVIIGIVALVTSRYRFVTASGTVALTLFYYGAYSLGGPEWIVGPGVGLMGYAAFYALRVPRATVRNPHYQVVAAFYLCLVPSVLLAANNVLETVTRWPAWLAGGDPFRPLFLGACAAQLGLSAWNLEPSSGGGPVGMPGWSDPAAAAAALPRDAAPRPARNAIVSTLLSSLAVLPAGLLTIHAAPGEVAAALGVALLAPPLYHAVRPLRWWPQPPPWNVRLQSLSVALAVLLVLPPYLGWLRG